MEERVALLQKERLCSIEGCERRHYARGWCQYHHNRWRRNGDPILRKPGGRNLNPPAYCTVEGCQRTHKARGLCDAHYRLWSLRGSTEYVRPPGRRSPRIYGGYRAVYAPGEPGAHVRDSYILEHRLVMQHLLQRPLRPEENVHHVNGDKLDNRPENLELWVVSQPKGQRVGDLLDWAHEIIARYGEGGQP